MHFSSCAQPHDRLQQRNERDCGSAGLCKPRRSAGRQLSKCGCAGHQDDEREHLIYEIQEGRASPMIARRIVGPILKLKAALGAFAWGQPFFGLCGGAWSDVTFVARSDLPKSLKFPGLVGAGFGCGFGIEPCPPLLLSATVPSLLGFVKLLRPGVSRKKCCSSHSPC